MLNWIKRLFPLASSPDDAPRRRPAFLRLFVTPSVLIGGVAVIALIEKTATYKVHVTPIRVQDTLEKKGYTPALVTDLLLDAVESRRQQTVSAAAVIEETARKSGSRWLVIGGITDTGQLDVERTLLAPLLSITVADLSIPETDMTVGSMARLLRLLIGLPMIEVRGDLFCPKGDDCAVDDAVLTVRYVEKPARFTHSDIRGYSATLPLGAPSLPFRQQVEVVAAQLVKAVDPGSIVPTGLSPQAAGTAAALPGEQPDIDRYVASLPYHKQASHFRALANYRAAQDWPAEIVLNLLTRGIEAAESEHDYERKVEVAGPLYLDRGAIRYHYRPKGTPPDDEATAAAVSQARLDLAAAARCDAVRPLALALRAYTYLRDGRLDLARMDYQQAALAAKKPEVIAAAQRGLGLIMLAQGESASARAALEAANRAYPTSNGLAAMGIIQFVYGNYHTAARYFENDFDRVDGDRGYAALLRYAAETLAGDRDGADRHLDVTLLEKSGPWIDVLADGLRGRISEDRVLAETVVDGRPSSGRQTEAAFYLGLRHFLAARAPHAAKAEHDAAVARFRQVLQTNNYHFTEWPAAAALLLRMGERPAVSAAPTG